VLTVQDIKKAVEKTAPGFPVKQVQLFGSYADGLANPDSDVDVIVEFSEWPVSLWTYCGFQQELSDLLGTKVDVIRLPLSEKLLNEITIQKVVHLYEKETDIRTACSTAAAEKPFPVCRAKAFGKRWGNVSQTHRIG